MSILSSVLLTSKFIGLRSYVLGPKFGFGKIVLLKKSWPPFLIDEESLAPILFSPKYFFAPLFFFKYYLGPHLVQIIIVGDNFLKLII